MTVRCVVVLQVEEEEAAKQSVKMQAIFGGFRVQRWVCCVVGISIARCVRPRVCSQRSRSES
jgi:hypothetical protein